MKITDLAQGQCCIVQTLRVRASMRQQLLSMGIYPGVRMKLERRGRKHSPLLCFVCGNFIMMREMDAQMIEVEVCVCKEK